MASSNPRIPDCLGSFVRALSKLQGVQDAVGERIYWPKYPPASVWSNDAPALVCRIQGGPVLRAGVAEARMQVKCFGGTMRSSDAADVFLVLAAALHDGFDAEEGLLAAWLETATEDVVDPDTGYPMVVAIFDCWFTSTGGQ